MATVNNWLTTVGGATDPGNYNQVPSAVDSPVVRKRYIDCSANGMNNGEYYKIFSVPANCLVRAHAICDVAEGAADTIDIALVLDSDTAAGSPIVLCDDFSVNSADTSSVYLVHNTVGFAASAAAVCVLANAALGTTKFWVVVEMIPLATTD